MNTKTLIVLNKYIKFVKLYDNELCKLNDYEKNTHYKNIKLLSTLSLLNKLLNNNSDKLNDVSINMFENKPFNYLSFCQNKVKNSLASASLKLRKKDFNLEKDDLLFSLLLLLEFSKLTKDYLKIEDIFLAIDTLENNKTTKKNNASLSENENISINEIFEIEELDNI